MKSQKDNLQIGHCDRIRMCVIVTVDITLLNLCRGRFEYLSAHGFDVTTICAPTSKAAQIESQGVRLVTAPLCRAITPVTDLVAIWRLYRFLRREKFDFVEVSTPKAALVGSIAAWLARVPHLVHLLRGLIYEDRRGIQRKLLKLSQTIPNRLAHLVISISDSLMHHAIDEGVCSSQKIRVLGSGSSNGVDLDRFTPPTHEERESFRRSLGIPTVAMVAGFVGRMTGDKGINELIKSFEEIAGRRENFYLLLVGDYENRDRPAKQIVNMISTHPRICHVGWKDETTSYYSAMDFLVLPSYREGFGTVLLEGAAMKLAIISTDIVGCKDAVVAGQTALVIPPRNCAALTSAMDKLAGDDSLRQKLGEQGRRRVEECFAQDHVWELQEKTFRRLIDNNDHAGKGGLHT